MRPQHAVRLLAAMAVGLALCCIALSLAWSRAHEEVLCWRAFRAEGEIPPEGDCSRL